MTFITSLLLYHIYSSKTPTYQISLQVWKGVGPSAVVRAEGGLEGRRGGEGGLQGVERADRHGEGQDAHRSGGKGLFTFVCLLEFVYF